MELEEYKYYKTKILGSLNKLKDKHKEAYTLLKNVENITHSSNDIPLSLIYTSISHIQSNNSKVVNELEGMIQALIPKKNTNEEDKTDQNTSKKDEPKKEPIVKKTENPNAPLEDEDDFDLDTDDELE